jgi:protein arginine N-methyltransferase 1
MYSIHEYGDMIADAGRTEAYARALRTHVAPGSVVVDVGAGAGILTLIACQAGARRVYAIEPENIIEVARELVRANGFADRVECIQALAADVTLAERADIIVSEVHGALPFFLQSPASLLDARDRFLKPGGVMIPSADVVMGAVVSLPEGFNRFSGPWRSLSGLDGTPAAQRALNQWGRWPCHADALVTPPARWVRLDYAQRDSGNAHGTLRWTMDRSAVAHGLCFWFDCETMPGCSFSNSPLADEHHIFGRAFFPWLAPCGLAEGDVVEVSVRADLVGGDYLWSWRTTIFEPDTATIKSHYEQSQFAGMPVPADWLRKTASTFVPLPNKNAAIDGMILDQLRARVGLAEIADRVAATFPDRFPTAHKALTRVGKLAMKYSD